MSNLQKRAVAAIPGAEEISLSFLKGMWAIDHSIHRKGERVFYIEECTEERNGNIGGCHASGSAFVMERVPREADCERDRHLRMGGLLETGLRNNIFKGMREAGLGKGRS